jgi:hypothetical protein
MCSVSRTPIAEKIFFVTVFSSSRGGDKHNKVWLPTYRAAAVYIFNENVGHMYCTVHWLLANVIRKFLQDYKRYGEWPKE